MSSGRAIIVTGADLAPQALELLKGFEIVYAGKTPQEEDLVALCRKHDPVAIIVRYGKVGYAVMDAAPSLRVISKHGSGTVRVASPRRASMLVIGAHSTDAPGCRHAPADPAAS